MTTEQTGRVASSGLRFFFAPQLGTSLNPARTILLSFVQILAQLMASANLIPATHRALNPATMADARLGEVLALAYSTVRRPGARLDQWTVFLAGSGLMGLLTLMLMYMIGQLLVGSAHALQININFGPQVQDCSFAAPASIFLSNCANDLAQQWIDVLLGGDPVGNMWWGSKMQFISQAMQTGLRDMFSTYSTAMLVLAGFLVLYHLLVIIAGTAHEGKLGGRSMNQLWAPIRLVMAIGMLVPLGGANGFNSGQMAVMHVAKFGSGLASNIWMSFANGYSSASGAFIIMPRLPDVAPLLKELLKSMVCEYAYNAYGAEMNNSFSVKITDWKYLSDRSNITRRSFQLKNNLVKSDSEYDVCGYVEMANPGYKASGSGFEFLQTDTTLNANNQARKSILDLHKKAIDDALTIGSPLDKLAEQIWEAANASNNTAVNDPNATLSTADLILFLDQVKAYRSTIQNGLWNAITAGGLDGYDMQVDAMARGWPSAAVWFNNIARLNGFISDVAQMIPTANSKIQNLIADYGGDSVDPTVARLFSAIESVDISLGKLPQIMVDTNNQGQFTEIGSLMQFANYGTGTDGADRFFRYLSENLTILLGKGGDNGNETIVPAAAGKAAQLELNTANPLAELSAIGYRLISLAIASTKLNKSCQAQQQKEVQETGMALTTCDTGSASFIIQAATGAMISAGVMLAFILPLMPFIRFMFGILAWVLSMFESVIAIPVVALAHIKMDGEGIAGPTARTAYLLLLQLFLRPALMIFGLILALVIFNFMIVALNEFFSAAIRSVEGGGDLGAINAVVYAVLYGVMAYAFANASFKAIDLVPSQCLQWIGGPNTSMASEADMVGRSVGGSISSIGTQAVSMQHRQSLMQRF